MIRVAVVGLGKMGMSHLAMARATPGVEVVAICDASGYLLGVLNKYTGLATYTDYEKLLDEAKPDAVIIATPSVFHAAQVETALNRGIHVFCEKPFVLSLADGERLAELAEAAGVVTQVGYHSRYIGAFQEVKNLLDQQAIGTVTHVLGEAYGPVVLKPKTGTWRSKKAEGGGALYDYAAHPLNLINWYVGQPVGVAGSVLNSIFSQEIDDEVYSTVYFDKGVSAQLSVNWSDDSVRKMTTRITVWGTTGRIFADRQECQVFLRGSDIPPGYSAGWNVRYTTDLTKPVSFYLRGEEYSAQLEEFAARIEKNSPRGQNDFASAIITDQTIAMIRQDALNGPGETAVAGGRQLTPAQVRLLRAADQASALASRARTGVAQVRKRVTEMRAK